MIDFKGYIFPKILILNVFILLSGAISCSTKSNLDDLGIGGEIHLVSKSEKSWKLSEKAKKVNLVFFGYTTCPDFCPMTLSKFKKLNQLLGDKAENVQYIFIGLDHKKDTPERLQEYVNFYVPNAVGLSGSEEELQKTVSDYKGSYSWNGNLIDHSTYTYLVDDALKTRYLFKHKDTAEHLAEIIRLLL